MCHMPLNLAVKTRVIGLLLNNLHNDFFVPP
jgi:hypothetical protein